MDLDGLFALTKKIFGVDIVEATAEEGAPDAEEDDEMFKAISDAFELLSTPKKRRESRLPETRSTRRREKAPQTRRREFDSLDEFASLGVSLKPKSKSFGM